MKRQPLEQKYGFTLFEIMVVMSIIGIFIAATGAFNLEPQTNAEKADRMVVRISGMLKEEIQNIAIGRMPKRDGEITTVSRIKLSTGGLIAEYYTGVTSTIALGSQSYIYPFYDRDTNYEIKSVVWTGSSMNLPYSGSGEVVIDPSGISFSGVGITGSGYNIVEVLVGYGQSRRKVTLDKRTGKITEVK